MIKKILTILLFLNLYFVICLTKLFGFLCRIFPRKKIKNSILFFENFPIENSGYHWRAGKWADIFNKNGYKAEVSTIFKSKQKFDKYLNKRTLEKFMIIAIYKRFFQILKSTKYETIIVRRELLLFNDYGNLFMEKFLLKIHPNAILDFDDDIAASKKEPRTISKFGKLMQENPSKFTETLKMYKRFIVGSNYLKDMVLSINKNISENDVCVIPTCVDYDKYEPKQYDIEKLNNEIVFGWVGGNQNLHILDIIILALNKIAENNNIKLIVVSGKDYINENAIFTIENQCWTLDTEVEQIKQFDIGLMPLENTKIAKGKCGFKLIQYMGLGVVGIATDITINGEIIEDGINGFLFKYDNSNMEEVLKKAISNIDNFAFIGKKARETIVNKYSFVANKKMFLKFVLRQNIFL